MAIRRWEMLLSAQADSYLLKIQGERTDVDRIVQAHSAVCQNVQEISEDTFQWAIFVVGATLAEKLAIQNQVMSLTTDAEGKKPSDSLLDVIEGLSGALQDLTNLTDDEQAYVMNKMARMGQPATATPLTGAAAGPAGVPTAPRAPTAPTTPRAPVVPGAGPSGPGQALPPVPGFTPGRVAPQPIPGRVAPGTPLPPVSLPGLPGVSQVPGTPNPVASPGIVRPVQPPKSFGPSVPQTPLPPVAMPKVVFPGVPIPSKPAPPTSPIQPSEPPKPPDPPAVKQPMPEQVPTSNKIPPPPPPPPVPPAPVELNLEKLIEPLAARSQPPITPPKPSALPEEKKEAPPAPPTDLSPFLELKPPTVPPPSARTTAKQEEGQIQTAIFYPSEGEEWKTEFLNKLSDIAQKKSKKPTQFVVSASVAGSISLENSAEWIWKSKTSGADIFFVILPPKIGADLMEPVVSEAEAAGLRCFLVPESEIQSKLLYMDIMVELMMFRKKIRPSST